MTGGEKNSRLKYLLEGAIPEIPAAGKWSRVEVRVRRLRRRRLFLRAGSALLALAVVVPAGLWVRAEIVDPGQKVVITDPRGVETGVPAYGPRTPAEIPGPVTTFGQAQTTVSTSAHGATSTVTTLHKEELKWGETATVEGGTVTVDAPVVDPAAKPSQPGFIAVYSVVTMTNTGKTPIFYSGRDFSLEGRHSGSTGIIDVQGAAGGQPILEGTLAPGQTVRGTVRFNLYQDDEPILVWLLVPWSKQIRLNWR